MLCVDAVMTAFPIIINGLRDRKIKHQGTSSRGKRLGSQIAATGPRIAGNLGGGAEGSTHTTGTEERSCRTVVFAEVEVDFTT